jgi:hypothetical protein
MPSKSDFVVPDQSYFVWQDVQVGVNHGGVNIEAPVVAEIRLRISTVSAKDVTGIVFHRWFFRKQI